MAKQSENKRNTVMSRYASQAHRRHDYTIGEVIGNHIFAGYVGDNPNAPYVRLTCGKCGAEFTRQKTALPELARRKQAGCKHCCAMRKAR